MTPEDKEFTAEIKCGHCKHKVRMEELYVHRETEEYDEPGPGPFGGDHWWVDDFHQLLQCPVCRGSGKVSLAPPVVRCAFCYGGGHAPRGSNATCPACRGTGFITVRPPIQVCTKCTGRGRQMGHPLYCGSCRGSGVVTVPESYELIGHGARSRINDRRTF